MTRTFETSLISRRAVLGSLLVPSWALGASWREFRGNGASSVPDSRSLPLEWSDRLNLLWSVRPEGYGQSSPVVEDGSVYTTSVDGPQKERLLVNSWAAATGELQWAHRDSPAQSIPDSDMVSRAAPTPVADSQGVYAFFETGNVVALDRDGNPRWNRVLTEEFGKFGGRHGIGSSLRLCRSGVLALVAHEGPSYLICLDRRSGETVWKTNRSAGVAWSTPALTNHAGRELALVSCGDRVESYDTADGRPLWTLAGFDGAFVASPTPTRTGAIVASGSKGHTAAIHFEDRADAIPRVGWRTDEAASYFSSPLVYNGRVYMVSKVGVAFCVDEETGKEVWRQRLAASCWASSIASGDCVYFFGVDGTVEVYRAADQPEKVAENRLSENSRLYGMAVSEHGILLRYGRRLACIGAA